MIFTVLEVDICLYRIGLFQIVSKGLLEFPHTDTETSLGNIGLKDGQSVSVWSHVGSQQCVVGEWFSPVPQINPEDV